WAASSFRPKARSAQLRPEAPHVVPGVADHPHRPEGADDLERAGAGRERVDYPLSHRVDAVHDALLLVRDPDRPVRCRRPARSRASTFPVAGSTCSTSPSLAWIQRSRVPVTNHPGRGSPTSIRATAPDAGSTRAIDVASRPKPTHNAPLRLVRPTGRAPI